MLSTLHSTRSLPEIQGINLDPRDIAGTGQTFRHTFDIYLKDSNAYANTYFSRYFEWQGVCRERWFHECISADMLQLKGVFITKRAHTEYLQETFPFQSVECELNTWDVRHCSVYVLFNLIKNSFYAIQAGGKGGDVFITVGGAAPGVLTFTDTGPGIPAAVKERIFEPYFSTKKSQRAGIGLAFCRRAIEAFGGSIACVSTPGDHATFTLAFPRVPAAPRDPAR